MDRRTKVKLAAGAVGVLAVAVAAGAAGGLAASLALDEGETRAAPSFSREERIEPFEPAEPPFLFDGFRRGFGVFPPFGDLEAAEEYLELTRSELREELEDGKTLAEIARDQGKSVDGLVDAMAEAAEERIDDAVDDGRLDEKDAEELKQDLEERLEDLVNGELRLAPRGFGGFEFGPGWFRDDRFPFGDRGFRAPRA